MSTRPFPKLFRTAAIVLVGVLLFNFFAYYLTWLRSRGNERMVSIISLAGDERMMSEKTVKDLLLVLDSNTIALDRDSLRAQIGNSANSFLDRNQVLRQEMASQGEGPSSGNLLEVTRLLTNAQTHV